MQGVFTFARRTPTSVFTVAMLATLATSCYSPSSTRCQIRCASADPRCPPSQLCGDDNYCHAAGEPAVCGAKNDADTSDGLKDSGADGPESSCAQGELPGDGACLCDSLNFRELPPVSSLTSVDADLSERMWVTPNNRLIFAYTDGPPTTAAAYVARFGTSWERVTVPLGFVGKHVGIAVSSTGRGTLFATQLSTNRLHNYQFSADSPGNLTFTDLQDVKQLASAKSRLSVDTFGLVDVVAVREVGNGTISEIRNGTTAPWSYTQISIASQDDRPSLVVTTESGSVMGSNIVYSTPTALRLWRRIGVAAPTDTVITVPTGMATFNSRVLPLLVESSTGRLGLLYRDVQMQGLAYNEFAKGSTNEWKTTPYVFAELGESTDAVTGVFSPRNPNWFFAMAPKRPTSTGITELKQVAFDVTGPTFETTSIVSGEPIARQTLVAIDHNGLIHVVFVDAERGLIRHFMKCL